MTYRRIGCLALILIAEFALHAQTTSQPFASLERAIKADRHGWAGDKSRLSAVFDSERRQLGDRFEAELLKWLGQDPERHYWISAFLEADSYLHGLRGCRLAINISSNEGFGPAGQGDGRIGL
jgi:hypothetical protein